MLRTLADSMREAGVSAGVIDGLVDEGALETLVLPPQPVARPPNPDHDTPELTVRELEIPLSEIHHAKIVQCGKLIRIGS